MTKDMTSGSPMRHVLSFAAPLILGNLFQQLYSLVDVIIVGRLLGTKAFAAVGSTGSISFLLIGFCLGICSGFSIPVAQRFGAKDYTDMKRYEGNILWLGMAFSLVMATATVLLCPFILRWMSTPPDIIDNAYRYIVVIFAGIPATMFYNTLAGLLRAVGDSRTPVIILTCSAVVNVALDLLFVLLIPLGVTGTALATIISQIISGLSCLVFIYKKVPALHISKESMKPERRYMLRLCGMGIPMGLQTSITAIGNVILQTSVNTLGSIAVASVTAGSKIFFFFDSITGALGVTMSTYGGQNLGANRPDRIRQGMRAAVIFGFSCAIASLIILTLFGRQLLLLFVDPAQTQVMDQAYFYMIANAAFLIPLTCVNTFRPLIQGIGFSKRAMFAGVFELVARGSTGLFLVPVFGFRAACFAGPLAWLMADSFLIPTYFWVMKRVEAGRIPGKA